MFLKRLPLLKVTYLLKCYYQKKVLTNLNRYPPPRPLFSHVSLVLFITTIFAPITGRSFNISSISCSKQQDQRLHPGVSFSTVLQKQSATQQY